MKTPIYSFLKKYSKSNKARFHMPGHKGSRILGCEECDITEIEGADVLSDPQGIILESERETSRLFDTAWSFYSTEGATLAINAMLALVRGENEGAKILATRNAHRSFLYACIKLGITPVFIDRETELCKSEFDIDALPSLIKEHKPVALYVTSPDYLGNILDISALSKICKEHSIPLLVDNAHGAYLHFLENSMHPIALGAVMCADSAHKTLPTLTGGAYLHVSKDANQKYLSRARTALSLFATTSPSYLILASLDKTNEYLKEKAREKIAKAVEYVEKCKQELTKIGYKVEKNEPLKITISCTDYGYLGTEIADYLEKSGVVCEFSDKEYLVLMASGENKKRDFKKLVLALSKLPRREKITLDIPKIKCNSRPLGIRQAFFSESEEIPTDTALNRVCHSVSVSCPPAIPIVICGELIDSEKIRALKFYGIEKISVVKEK